MPVRNAPAEGNRGACATAVAAERQDGFKSSALELHQGGFADAAGSELSDWQQRHAALVLARAKELDKIRYDLCPRDMKDKQF